MKRVRMVEKETLECDGCQYAMSMEAPRITITVPFDFEWPEEAREDRTLEFHFHVLKQRHDCFRYWAHNPHTMRRSLRDRGLTQDAIDSFMELMLYRDDSRVGSPGIPKNEKTTQHG